MPRSYFGGWYYALKDLKLAVKSKSKIRMMFFKQSIRNGYYWMTPEERMQKTNDSFKRAQEIVSNTYKNVECNQETTDAWKNDKYYCFELTGVVETDGLTHDEFLDAVTEWVESKGWSYGGAVQTVDEKYDHDYDYDED